MRLSYQSIIGSIYEWWSETRPLYKRFGPGWFLLTFWAKHMNVLLTFQNIKNRIEYGSIKKNLCPQLDQLI